MAVGGEACSDREMPCTIGGIRVPDGAGGWVLCRRGHGYALLVLGFMMVLMAGCLPVLMKPQHEYGDSGMGSLNAPCDLHSDAYRSTV